jgi:nicotinamidase-related amidase
MARNPYPHDLLPLVPDLTHRRACLLVIDNQKTFIKEHQLTGDKKSKVKPELAHYSWAVPRFVTLAENYMDVIHISYTDEAELDENIDKPEFFDSQRLWIPNSITHFTKATPLAVDFLHGFDPRSDLYYPKRGNDALRGPVLRDYILRKNYGSVFLSGVRFRACFAETHDGLQKFKKNHKPDLRIAALCDLTDHSWQRASPMTQKAHLRLELGKETYIATAQDILSIWNDVYKINLDFDLPTVVNQAMIRKTLQA